MKIYFIRHGLTHENRYAIHQHDSVKLSQHGRIQIQQAASVLKQFPITKLITSDLTRAKESAEILSQELNIPHEEHKLFREVERPSILTGKWHYHPLTAYIGLQMMLHIQNPAWHYSDEENLFDLKQRVQAAVAYLDSLKDEHEHVVVVSHSFIINLFLRYMCDGGEVRVRDYLATLLSAKIMKNGSISLVSYENDHNPFTCDFTSISYANKDHLRK